MDFFRKLLVVVALVSGALILISVTGVLVPEEQGDPTAILHGDGTGTVRYLLHLGRNWPAALGTLGLFAVGAYWLLSRAGQPPPKELPPVRAPEERPPHADFTVVDLEVVVGQMLSGGDGIPFGEGTPPAFTVKALAEAKDRWIAVGARCDERDDYDSARQSFQSSADAVSGAVPVRGERGGEAASFRLALMVGVKGLPPPDDAPALLAALGRLSGDRILELKTSRIPAQNDHFAPALTVTGELAAAGYGASA